MKSKSYLYILIIFLILVNISCSTKIKTKHVADADNKNLAMINNELDGVYIVSENSFKKLQERLIEAMDEEAKNSMLMMAVSMYYPGRTLEVIIQDNILEGIDLMEVKDSSLNNQASYFYANFSDMQNDTLPIATRFNSGRSYLVITEKGTLKLDLGLDFSLPLEKTNRDTFSTEAKDRLLTIGQEEIDLVKFNSNLGIWRKKVETDEKNNINSFLEMYVETLPVKIGSMGYRTYHIKTKFQNDRVSFELYLKERWKYRTVPSLLPQQVKFYNIKSAKQIIESVKENKRMQEEWTKQKQENYIKKTNEYYKSLIETAEVTIKYKNGDEKVQYFTTDEEGYNLYELATDENHLVRDHLLNGTGPVEITIVTFPSREEGNNGSKTFIMDTKNFKSALKNLN